MQQTKYRKFDDGLSCKTKALTANYLISPKLKLNCRKGKTTRVL